LTLFDQPNDAAAYAITNCSNLQGAVLVLLEWQVFNNSAECIYFNTLYIRPFQHKRMNAKSIYFLIGCISSIFTVCTMWLYFSQFSGSYSKEQADWGAFGDYVGGVLNPIIGFLNLGVLIYISVLVNKSDREIRQRDRDSERQNALYSLRNEAIKEVQNILKEIEKFHSSSEPGDSGLIVISYMKLDSFFIYNKHLFPFLENEQSQPLLKSSRHISKAAQTLKEFDDIEYSYEFQDAMGSYGGSWDCYLREKNSLIGKMQACFLQN
jgi:hypothetical protein